MQKGHDIHFKFDTYLKTKTKHVQFLIFLNMYL